MRENLVSLLFPTSVCFFISLLCSKCETILKKKAQMYTVILIACDDERELRLLFDINLQRSMDIYIALIIIIIFTSQ